MSQDMDYPGNMFIFSTNFLLLKAKELGSNNYNATERNIFLL